MSEHTVDSMVLKIGADTSGFDASVKSVLDGIDKIEGKGKVKVGSPIEKRDTFRQYLANKLNLSKKESYKQEIKEKEVLEKTDKSTASFLAKLKIIPKALFSIKDSSLSSFGAVLGMFGATGAAAAYAVNKIGEFAGFKRFAENVGASAKEVKSLSEAAQIAGDDAKALQEVMHDIAREQTHYRFGEDTSQITKGLTRLEMDANSFLSWTGKEGFKKGLIDINEHLTKLQIPREQKATILEDMGFGGIENLLLQKPEELKQQLDKMDNVFKDYDKTANKAEETRKWWAEWWVKFTALPGKIYTNPLNTPKILFDYNSTKIISKELEETGNTLIQKQLDKNKQYKKQTQSLAHSPIADLIAAKDAGGKDPYETFNQRKGGWKPENGNEAQRLTTKSIDEIINLKSIGKIGAAGRTQVVKDTLNLFKKQTGKTGNELFDKSLQDELMDWLLRDALGDFLNTPLTEKSLKKANDRLAAVFMALQNSKGGNKFNGVNGNHAFVTPEIIQEKLIETYNSNRGNKITPKGKYTETNEGDVSFYDMMIGNNTNAPLNNYGASKSASVLSAPRHPITAPPTSTTSTHIGEITINTTAPPGDDMVRDMNRAMDSSFPSHAVSGYQ